VAIDASGGPFRQRLIVVAQMRRCRTLPGENRAPKIVRFAALFSMRKKRSAK
jgi:hypothetical protein